MTDVVVIYQTTHNFKIAGRLLNNILVQQRFISRLSP